jgi:ABC-type Fe3+/spermidine/putrescine transport system ATPase subunit
MHLANTLNYIFKEAIQMAEKIITKKNGKGEDVFYHAEAEFIPTKVDDICAEFIENYCVANGEIEWLVETCGKKTVSKRKVKNDEGEVVGTKEVEIAYTFANIRSDFVQKFFPQILKGDKANKPLSFADRIKQKYGK